MFCLKKYYLFQFKSFLISDQSKFFEECLKIFLFGKQIVPSIQYILYTRKIWYQHLIQILITVLNFLNAQTNSISYDLSIENTDLNASIKFL